MVKLSFVFALNNLTIEQLSLAMYCTTCGIDNSEEASLCRICESPLATEASAETAKVFTDLTRYPFRALLASFRYVNPLVIPLALPIVTLTYAVKKLTGTPFITPMLNNALPTFRQIHLEEFRNLHRKSFDPAARYLEKQGFVPLLDIEETSQIQGNLQRLLIHPQHHLYGSLHVHKGTGKLMHATLFAITEDKHYFSVDNTFGLPLRLPPNIHVKHFPNQPIKELRRELSQQITESGSVPRSLPLQYLLTIGFRIRKVSIQCGLEQGFFQINKPGAPHRSITTCYHHPTSAAVRTCSVCRTPLCEACYTRYQQAVYCARCLPKDAEMSKVPPVPIADMSYAGAGVRVLTTLLDATLLVGIIVGVFLGIRYGLSEWLSDNDLFVTAFLATQVFGVTLIVAYQILALRLYGRTIGQAIFGVRVIDRYGGLPETSATLVRLGYHVIAGLFIFPIIGYFIVPFRRTKQGLHDQLAGTFVVTKRPRLKAIVAWLLIISLIGGAGWYTVPRILPVLPYLMALLPPYTVPEPEITLPPVWTQYNEEDVFLSSYTLRENLCIAATSTALQAFDLRSGEQVWNNDQFQNIIIQVTSEDPMLPLLALNYPDDEHVSLLRIAPDSGDILWEQSLESHELFVTFDNDTVLVYDARLLRAYTADGVILWEQRFEDAFDIDYVVLNQNVLLTRYKEEEQIFTYLDRDTGQVLWQWERSPYYVGQSLGQEYQAVYSLQGMLALLSLPQQQILWELPQEIGHLITYEIDPQTGLPTTLYTATAIVRAEDGAILFSYPEDTRFGCLTENFLALLSSTENPELILVNASTGHSVWRYPGKDWFTLQYLTENETTLYLIAHQQSGNPQEREITSSLILLDKESFEYQEYQIGANLGGAQFMVFPDEQIMFIATYQHIGAYMLPER